MNVTAHPAETELLQHVRAEAATRGLDLPAVPALWWPWASTVPREAPAAVPAARLLPWNQVATTGPMVVLPIGIHQRTLILALQPQVSTHPAWEIDWNAWTSA